MITNNFNNMGKPKFVYRIDTKSPEVVFKQGFLPWGKNRDFISHILGISQNPHSPKNLRTNYISTTSSIDVALRLYAGMLSKEHKDSPKVNFYLYEIRADENFYSSTMTTSKAIELLRNNKVDNLNIQNHQIYNLISYAIDASFMDYSWQKEYLSDGAISPQNVKSVTLLSHLDIDQDLIRYKTNPKQLYTHVYLNSKPVLNPYYIEQETYAANKPLDIELPTELPSLLFKETTESKKLKIQGLLDELLEVDNYWSTRSSMGMMCPTPQLANDSNQSVIPSTGADNLPEGYEQFKYCYIGKTLTPSTAPSYIGQFNPITSKNGAPLQETELHFEAESGLQFYACEQMYKDQMYIGINGDGKKTKTPIKVYLDAFGRLVWNRDKNQYYAITPKRWFLSSSDAYQYLTPRLQAINEEEQEWHLQLVKVKYDSTNSNKPTKYLFRLVNSMYPHYVMCINKNTPSNFIWMTTVDQLADDLEEIYVAISPSETDACILMAQKPTTILVNIDLKWYLHGIPYTPDAKSNTSAVNYNKTYQYYYCLKTQNIYYYSYGESKFWALKNERNLSHYIAWPRWVEVEFGSKYYHTGYKWYFIQPQRSDIDQYNYREIRCYLYNDYLKTPPTGLDWGSLYINWDPNENNAIKVFVIDKNSNV